MYKHDLRIYFTVLWVGIILITSSCKKAGPNGDADVSVNVKHHGTSIPGSTVFVKYNAEEYPGPDATSYDLSVVSGTSGHSAGHTHVNDLGQGYYYFYAAGFDSSISQKVSGGVALHIKRKERKKEFTLDIPVTE